MIMDKISRCLITGVCVLCVASGVFAYEQQEFVYDSGDRRDPFVQLVSSDGRFVQIEPVRKDEEAESSESALRIEGIIYDKFGLSYALVNGSVVKVGEFVNDFQVLKIEPDKVVFIKEGQPLDVFLQKEE
jgi:hypothetical protein